MFRKVLGTLHVSLLPLQLSRRSCSIKPRQLMSTLTRLPLALLTLISMSAVASLTNQARVVLCLLTVVSFSLFANAGQDWGGIGEYWDPAWYESTNANGDGFYIERGQSIETEQLFDGWVQRHYQYSFEYEIVNGSIKNPQGSDVGNEIYWSEDDFEFSTFAAGLKVLPGPGDWAWDWRFQVYGGARSLYEADTEGSLAGYLVYDDFVAPVPTVSPPPSIEISYIFSFESGFGGAWDFDIVRSQFVGNEYVCDLCQVFGGDWENCYGIGTRINWEPLPIPDGTPLDWLYSIFDAYDLRNHAFWFPSPTVVPVLPVWSEQYIKEFWPVL